MVQGESVASARKHRGHRSRSPGAGSSGLQLATTEESIFRSDDEPRRSSSLQLATTGGLFSAHGEHPQLIADADSANSTEMSDALVEVDETEKHLESMRSRFIGQMIAAV